MHGNDASACRERTARDLVPRHVEARVEQLAVGRQVLHMHRKPLRRYAEAPVVAHVHRYERGDVKRLRKSIPQQRGVQVTLGFGEHVSVPLVPWCVRDLGDDALDASVSGVETVIERDRIECDPEVPEVRQHADRASGSDAGPSRNARADGSIDGQRRIAEIVLATQPRGRRPSG